jgi:hypothetical protein
MRGSPSSVACEECGESYLAEARMLIFILCFIRGEYAFVSLFGYMVLNPWSLIVSVSDTSKVTSAFPRIGEQLSSSLANVP